MRTNTHDNGHGGAYVRKREVRALARVCSPMAFIVALLAVLLVPTIALADSSVIWGPSSIPNAENGIVVNAPDRYRAAAVALGYGDDAYSAWSDEVKAKLSNASTGGHFYQFAQLFGEIDDAVGDDNPLTAVVSAVGNAFWAIAETLYGDNIWLAGYSSELAAGAASDLSSILAGQNIGGGGSGGGGGSPSAITWNTLELTNKAGECYGNGVWSPMSSYTVTLHIDDAFKNQLNSELPSFAKWFVLMKHHNGNSSKFVLEFYMTAKDVTLGINGNPSSSQLALFQAAYDGTSISYREYALPNRWSSSNDIVVNHSAKTIDFYFRNDNDSTYNSTHNANPWVLGNGNGFAWSDGTEAPVPVPPTNWPDEPEAPEPPELPEPSNPVVEPPDPYEPSTGPTFIWNITNTSEPTDTSSLLEWIKKIFYELKAIHSDLKTWFQNLGTALTDGFEAMDDACGQIYDAITENTDELQDQFQSLKTYLKQLFQWLGDKMNFQANGYDDTSVIYWLKRIWSKLGNGDINLRPTDPTNDPDDWWDWLVRAIQNFLIGLAATSTELISEIADLASQVMHEFPFSIPWDIAAVLAALSTSPVTPVFTITIPAVNVWWASFDIVIDMSPYNGAAETIRLMEKLLFTGLLIWKSKELLDFMDVTRWFD